MDSGLRSLGFSESSDWLAGDPAPPQEELAFERKLEGSWKLVSLGPGTCTYRAARHFARHAFHRPPKLVLEPDFFAGRRRAQVETGPTLLLLPCVHEVFADVYASPHWQLLEGYWFHIKNPPLYLAAKPGTADRRPATCAAIGRLRPLLADPDGHHVFRYIDVQTTQEAAQMVVDERCGYCITNVYGVQRFGVEAIRELKCIRIGWYSFEYRPRPLSLPTSGAAT